MFDELSGLVCLVQPDSVPGLAKFDKGKNGLKHPSCGRENVSLESHAWPRLCAVVGLSVNSSENRASHDSDSSEIHFSSAAVLPLDGASQAKF